MNTKQSRRHSTTANPVGITHDLGVTHASPLHHRRSIRLRGYDYSQAGAYFVTVCVQGRERLFGDVVDGEMRLNDAGQMVAQCWHELPAHFPHLELDEFVVMPNHMHGIIIIVGAPFMAPYGPGAVNPGAMNHGAVNPGAINRAPTGGDRVPFVGAPFMAPDDHGAVNPGAVNPGAVNPGAINRAPTLGEIVRSFKALATRRIRQSGVTAFAWQRNYYEHIIRDEESLNRIREYIRNNPLQWALDRENPHSTGAVRNPPIPKDEPWRI
jgi:putative transposase